MFFGIFFQLVKLNLSEKEYVSLKKGYQMNEKKKIGKRIEAH